MTNPPDSEGTPSPEWSSPGGQWGAPDQGGYSTPGQDHPQAPGQYQQPGQYHQPGQMPPHNQGFITAQPGIIPLRPLGLGQIYNGAFRALRANPAVMFVFSGVLLTISTIIELSLAAPFLNRYFSFFTLVEQDPEAVSALTDDDILAMFTGAIAPVIIGAVISLIVSTILTGVLTFAVSQAVLGYKPTIGQVWDQAKGQIIRLIGLVLLVGVISAAVPALLFTLVILLATTGAVGLTILLGVIAFLVFIAWILFIITATALATPALMLERCGPITALRRGWALARPFFWRVMGIYLLTMLIAGGAAYVIATPVGLAMFALPPTGILIAQGLSTVISSTLVTPFTAAVIALLYIDVRIRREGLATELAAAAATK